MSRSLSFYMGRVRGIAVLAGIVVLLAAGAVWIQLRPAMPAASGPAVATLLVLTGSAQVTRAGVATAVIGRSGEQLRAGDRVATGPGSRARLTFEAGDQALLDSGTIATATRTGLDLLGGQAWIRNLSGTALSVTAGRRRFQANTRGDELAVTPNGAVAYAGRVEGARTAAGGDLVSPWAALNEALDQDASPEGPAALGSGTLLPGEESSAQQAVTITPGGAAPDLQFTAAWTAGSLELTVVDPNGAVFAKASGPKQPLSLRVPKAAAGGWEFRVRQLSGGEAGDDWFVVISQIPG